jgi:hypothetical protein
MSVRRSRNVFTWWRLEGAKLRSVLSGALGIIPSQRDNVPGVRCSSREVPAVSNMEPFKGCQNTVHTGIDSIWKNGAPGDCAERIDHEQRALGSVAMGVEHTIRAGDLASGPIVGQQRERQLMRVGECRVRPDRIAGDRQDVRPQSRQLGMEVAVPRELGRTHRVPVGDVEDNHQRSSAVVREPGVAMLTAA